MPIEGLTARQRQYAQSLAANLERNSGRSLAQWLAIARTCPESAPRARLRWFKENHGLGQNYAMQVLERLDGERGRAAPSPRELRARLWSQPESLKILIALEKATRELPQVIAGQRKGYTAWSRAFAFAAARPYRRQVRLGLALSPAADKRLQRAQREGWSERLTSTLQIAVSADVDAAVRALLRAAWQRS